MSVCLCVRDTAPGQDPRACRALVMAALRLKRAVSSWEGAYRPGVGASEKGVIGMHDIVSDQEELRVSGSEPIPSGVRDRLSLITDIHRGRGRESWRLDPPAPL